MGRSYLSEQSRTCQNEPHGQESDMYATAFAAFQLHAYESAQLDRDHAVRAAQAERRPARSRGGEDCHPRHYALAGPAA